MYTLSDKIEVVSVHTFKSMCSKDHDMVEVSVEMPRDLWAKIHMYCNVDVKGNPIEEQHQPLYKPNQLIWEQKNRKEKDK